MPQQELYLELKFSGGRIEVVKSFDGKFAREVFEQMEDGAREFLSRSLNLAAKYDFADEPGADDADALWQEIEDGARESWDTFSYFVVSEQKAEKSIPIFVSADWPSAEAFAKSRLP